MRPLILLPALLTGLCAAAGASEPVRLEGIVVTATLREVPVEELPASAGSSINERMATLLSWNYAQRGIRAISR